MTAQNKKPSPEAISIETKQLASDLDEEIRRHAYELYEQRGRMDGYDIEDWLQSESEVKSKHKPTAIAA